MNTMMTGPAPHLGDDELLRLIDNDGDAQWRAEKESHVAGCQQCTAELDALRADQLLVHDWITAAAFEADRSPRRSATARVMDSGWLRAAAVLLMIAGPVAALPGLRAWIADAVTGSAPAGDVRTMSAPAVATEAAVVRFVPAPGTFVVSIDAAQRGGMLHVRSTDGAEATLEMNAAGDAPVTEPVFAESSLRLRNAAESDSDYTLSLPASVTRLVVTVGSSRVAELDGQRLQAGTSIRLSTR